MAKVNPGHWRVHLCVQRNDYDALVDYGLLEGSKDLTDPYFFRELRKFVGVANLPMKVGDLPKASAKRILSGTRWRLDLEQWLSTINSKIWGISWVVWRKVGSKADILEEYSTPDVFLRERPWDPGSSVDFSSDLDTDDEEHACVNSADLLRYYNFQQALSDSSTKIIQNLPIVHSQSIGGLEDEYQGGRNWGILVKERPQIEKWQRHTTWTFLALLISTYVAEYLLLFLGDLFAWLIPSTTVAGVVLLLVPLSMPRQLPESITRLEWTCRCGHRSYDDYSIGTELVRRLAARMRRSGVVTRAETTNKGAAMLTTLVYFVRNGIIALWRRVHQEKDRGRTAEQTQDTIQVERQASTGRPRAYLYVGLCFQGKAFAPWLSHLKVSPSSTDGVLVNSDQELFRQLRKKRQQEEGNRDFHLSGIVFIKFVLRPGGTVDDVEEGEFPPRENTNYLYRVPYRKDGKVAFPGSNWLVHLYHDPSTAADSTICLEAFPKKKDEPHTWKRPVYPEGNEPLAEGVEDENVGWGVYLKSSPRKTWSPAIKAIAQLVTAVVIGVLALVETKNKPALAIVGIVSGVVASSVDWLEAWLVRKTFKTKAD